jgi:hypothetical protein
LNIVNVMWSGGSPFMSVHTVHRQVAHAPVGMQVSNWLLLGDGLSSGIGKPRWHLPSRVLKGACPIV